MIITKFRSSVFALLLVAAFSQVSAQADSIEYGRQYSVKPRKLAQCPYTDIVFTGYDAKTMAFLLTNSTGATSPYTGVMMLGRESVDIGNGVTRTFDGLEGRTPVSVRWVTKIEEKSGNRLLNTTTHDLIRFRDYSTRGVRGQLKIEGKIEALAHLPIEFECEFN